MSTIAEKLQLIAENEQKVYDAGYAAGQADGGGDKWQGLREVVAEKNTLDRFFADTSITEVPSNLETSKCTIFSYMCSGCKKLVSTSEFDTSNSKGFRNMYSGCVELTGTVTLDLASVPQGNYSMASVFQNCYKIKKVVLKNIHSNITYWAYCFFVCKELETIEGALDFTNATSIDNCLGQCYALRDIEFVPNSVYLSLNMRHSASLTDESIQSIIDGLADLTGSKTKTLTLHAAIVLTEEQIAAITAKNWTLVQ